VTDATPAVDPARTALLVMDYQAWVLDRVPRSAELLIRAADTIAMIRGYGGQIGYVRMAFEDPDYDAIPPTSMMGARIASAGRTFHADSPATAIPDRIAPQPDDIVVRKTRVGAFSTTDLDEQLRRRGIDTLILAGLSTSGVVLSTIRDAHDRDYRVFVLADLTADPDEEVHDFLIGRVFPRQAQVITSADLSGLMSQPGDDGL
jgi:nicotinamidase-related amidase